MIFKKKRGRRRAKKAIKYRGGHDLIKKLDRAKRQGPGPKEGGK